MIQRAEKVLARINELATISEDEHGITRTFGTKAFLQGSQKVYAWMLEAGLQTHIDNIGNVRGKLVSKNPHAKTFVIASHIDTVVNAGKFDGPLGVLLGLDLLEELIKTNTQLPFHIELIAFSDEEGVRFHTTYLGSKVVAGLFDENLLTQKDKNGITLLDAIHAFGGDTTQLAGDAIAKNDWLGYLEIHIEQGPVLYEKDIPVAIVTAIAGQKRVEIVFTGMAGHAGTVPMDMRQDALCSAAEFIIETEKFAIVNKAIVATVGTLGISNAASNVIPGQVVCSLDLRSHDEAALTSAYQAIQASCMAIANKRNIGVAWKLIQETKPVTCDEKLQDNLQQAIVQAGYEVIQLVSGAGHDAVPISQVSPVAMLFVRCYKGISHNPLEDAELKDIAAAIKVLDDIFE